MFLKKILPLILLLLIFSSCQDNNTVSLDYSVGSEQDNGFSFNKMAVLSNDVNQNINADFIVLPQMSDSGKLLAPFLVQTELKSSFLLSKQFDNLMAAEQYYNNYTSFSDNGSVFDYNAIPVKPFQVWIVITNANLYGKILISEASAAYVNNSPNAVVNFKAELLK